MFKNRSIKFWQHKNAPLVAFVVLTLAIAYAFNLHSNRIDSNVNKIQATQQLEREAIYGSCHRLNIIRASDNRNHDADYHFFTLTIRLLQVSLAHPAHPITRSGHRNTVRFIKQLQDSAHAKTWIPLTDCNEAVLHPLSVPGSPAIRFSQRMPPQSALHPGPGN